MHLIIGILLVVAGGSLEGLFSLPVTRTPRWKWENTWGLGSLVALLLIPWPVALLTVPNLMHVYAQVPTQVLVVALLCGLGWGVGGIFWGKAIAAVGMALGISLLMGLLNVFASPVLLAITKGPAQLAEPGGLVLLLAVAIMVAGVAVCAIAGARKAKELASGKATTAGNRPSTSFAAGLGFCILSAVLSALVNFGFVFGEPIGIAADNAIRAAAGEPSHESLLQAGQKNIEVDFRANNAIWALVFTSNFAVNAAYALYLMRKNRTGKLIASEGSLGYWLWALFMGIAWPLGIVLFGIGSNAMGKYGPYVAFPMMLVMAILFGNLAGALTGEWRGSSARTKMTMLAGVAILVAAFAVFGVSNKLMSGS